MVNYAYRFNTMDTCSVLEFTKHLMIFDFLYFQIEEVCWMERQLRICHERCVKECKFSSKFINDLIEQGQSLDAISESELIDNFQNRCQLILRLHHEYRQLCEDKTLQDISQNIHDNVRIAVAFFLAYIDTRQVELQTELLEGINSKAIYSEINYQVNGIYDTSLRDNK